VSHQKVDVRRARQGLARLDALLEAYPELREPDAQARLTAWLEEEQRAMTDYAEKTRARVQRMRERRKQAGWLQYELWLDPASAALIDQLKQPGESLSGMVQRALQALAQASVRQNVVTSNDTSKTNGNVTSNAQVRTLSQQQRKAALLPRLLEMKAQGLSLQKIVDQLTREGIQTLTGDGQWHKRTIGKLLAKTQDDRIT
jgi:hypothetical protein